MADQPKKPRNIKDLKARLGRTITPGQEGQQEQQPQGQQPQGQPPQAQPPQGAQQGPAPAGPPAGQPGGQPPGAAPPVAQGAPQPAQQPQPSQQPAPPPGFGRPGGVPQPGPGPGGSSAPPPPAVPGGPQGPGAPGASVPPPFGQGPQQPQPQASGGQAGASADPFGAAPAQAAPQQQEMRLVVDDQPVSDQEVGRQQRGRAIYFAVGAAVLGLVVGYGMGSVMAERGLYNMGVRDGQQIYEKVRQASNVVEEARGHIQEAVQAAKSQGGDSPKVDYESIKKLRALEQPFEAKDFARKRYSAFKPNTVDQLFTYFTNVTTLWGQFTSLANRTLPDKRRKVLDRAAKAAGKMGGTKTGCVLAKNKKSDQLQCGLVFVHGPAEDKKGKVLVSTTLDGRTYERTLYKGQDGLLQNPGDYVIINDRKKSSGVLGQPASAFTKYKRELFQINSKMEKTIKVQGRLEKGLGEVATLEPVFAL